ncbi:uncharacterized protein JCM10292_000516 [Rhodotorula paludigena]|uniref:uncharacterized protein n=1 Tax=Rhodotorula paludigena TaxID=86838 RepID=UPI0031776C1F
MDPALDASTGGVHPAPLPPGPCTVPGELPPQLSSSSSTHIRTSPLDEQRDVKSSTTTTTRLKNAALQSRDKSDSPHAPSLSTTVTASTTTATTSPSALSNSPQTPVSVPGRHLSTSASHRTASGKLPSAPGSNRHSHTPGADADTRIAKLEAAIDREQRARIRAETRSEFERASRLALADAAEREKKDLSEENAGLAAELELVTSDLSAAVVSHKLAAQQAQSANALLQVTRAELGDADSSIEAQRNKCKDLMRKLAAERTRREADVARVKELEAAHKADQAEATRLADELELERDARRQDAACYDAFLAKQARKKRQDAVCDGHFSGCTPPPDALQAGADDGTQAQSWTGAPPRKAKLVVKTGRPPAAHNPIPAFGPGAPMTHREPAAILLKEKENKPMASATFVPLCDGPYRTAAGNPPLAPCSPPKRPDTVDIDLTGADEDEETDDDQDMAMAEANKEDAENKKEDEDEEAGNQAGLHTLCSCQINPHARRPQLKEVRFSNH